MNVFQLLLAALVAATVLYIVGTQFAPLFNPEANISSYAQTLLVEAQGDLGHAKGVALSLQKGQTLYARNLDTPTRTVAFACATPSCCPALLNECTQPLSASGDRLVVNQNVKTTLTARCISRAGIHACKIYAGNAPAQLEMMPGTIPTMADIDGQKELPLDIAIQNTGFVPATNVKVSVDLLEKQTQGIGETTSVIAHDEVDIPIVENGKTIRANLKLILERTGNFTLRITAEGEDAGQATQTSALTITGNEPSLCEPDTTIDETAVIDSFNNVCRKKVYCLACDFAFQCRNAWKEQYPLSPPQHYDENRGENGFAYVLSPIQNGEC